MGADQRFADERKFVDLSVDEVAPDGSFSGYASLFGTVDLGRDVVERGAFARSLKARGAAGIRMLYQHDPNEPIGAWTEIREDAKGLFVRGRLATGVARAREVLDLMRAGALDGLSIGFRAVRARTDAASGVRRIIEADLWEISVVTFPMLPGARVDRVKGARGVSSKRNKAATIATPTPIPSPQGGGGSRGRVLLRQPSTILAEKRAAASPSPLRGGDRGGGQASEEARLVTAIRRAARTMNERKR